MSNDTTPDPAPRGTSLSIDASGFESVINNHYTSEQAEILRYWFFTAKENQWSLGQLQKITGVSSTSLSRIFRGIYGADVASLCESLGKAKSNYLANTDNPEFIQTSLAARLFAVCDKTRATRTVSILWGEMGIGKTTILNEYTRLNSGGKTIYLRYPAGASHAQFMYQLARACGLAPRAYNSAQLREKLYTLLGMGQRLIIVDELHQAFLTSRGDTAVRCIETLREISDLADCGMVLCGTNALSEHFFKGQHKDALAQLVDRGTMQIALPAKASKGDYKKFLTAYRLELPSESSEPEAYSILNDIIRLSGLRKLTLHLRDGAAYARKCQQAYNWDHFTAAFNAIQSLSK